MTAPATPPPAAASPYLAAIVITTHNRPDYLAQTIESAIRQDFLGRWEVVVVDDGSTDQTADVVWKYVHRHGDAGGPFTLRYVRQDNQGLAVARNTGVANTTAPLIAFVDDDDLCEPRKLALQAPCFADPQVGLCHTSFRYIDADGRFTDAGPQRLDNPCVGWCVDALLNELVVISSTVMVRRSTLLQAAAAEPHGLPYDPRWVRSQDYDMALRMARIAKFAYVPEPLLRYRFHDSNIAMSKGNIARAFGYHCQVQIEFARRWGPQVGVDEAEARRRVRRFLYQRAESHFWQRKLDIARQLCDLARELAVYDEGFAQLERRARRPRWMYRAKDALDRLRGGGMPERKNPA